jgi:hypothetical protein
MCAASDCSLVLSQIESPRRARLLVDGWGIVTVRGTAEGLRVGALRGGTHFRSQQVIRATLFFEVADDAGAAILTSHNVSWNLLLAVDLYSFLDLCRLQRDSFDGSQCLLLKRVPWRRIAKLHTAARRHLETGVRAAPMLHHLCCKNSRL